MTQKIDGIKQLLDKQFGLNFVRTNSIDHDLWSSNISNSGDQILAFGLTDDDGMYLSILKLDEFGNVTDRPIIRL